jgi:hypothetical protein
LMKQVKHRVIMTERLLVFGMYKMNCKVMFVLNFLESDTVSDGDVGGHIIVST